MKTTSEKLNIMRENFRARKARVMIIGLGSVGNYLLDYLMSSADENMEIAVVGRNAQKMESDVNIVRVASLIRGQNKSTITVIGDTDLNNVSSIENAICSYKPDIIVNSSRAYAGLNMVAFHGKTFVHMGFGVRLQSNLQKILCRHMKMPDQMRSLSIHHIQMRLFPG